ncbi:MAG: hypothetical protein V2I43_25835 [Parvularcula sp.]|jgi:hypothetical protein|nr:hypothetical protein [Parvularcula sp.]
MLTVCGEKLVLPTSDPGVRTATGHRRFLIGLDLGQAQDPSAYVVMRDEAIPEWHTSITQRLGERQRTVVAADRIRDTSYVEVARIAGALMASSAIAGRCHLCIDATGVGRAFGDVLDEMGIKHTKLQMVGGMSENRDGRFWNVSKNRLMAGLNGALHTRKLTLGAFDQRDALAQEFSSFQVTWSAAGNMRLEGGDDEGHADMVIATAMAWWLSDSRGLNNHFDSGRLYGWW